MLPRLLRRRASRPRSRAALAVTAAVLGAAVPGGGCEQIAGLTDHQLYPILQIAAGATHACVLLRNGEVWCWGANDNGQLGHRTNDGGSDCTTACPAGAVENLANAVQVSAGDGFTCAVLADGSVSCWGLNQGGQLGRSTSTTCAASGMPCDTYPDKVVGVSDAAQVSAGAGYACARTHTGSVLCWGGDLYGQLGDGAFSPSTVAAKPIKMFLAVDVSTSLDGDSTCAVKGDGTVWCWGRNDGGAVGHVSLSTDPMCGGGMPMHPCFSDPQPVAGIAGSAPVRAGCSAGCVALTTGGFSCWGYDGSGCLGAKAVGAMNVNPPGPVVATGNLAAIDMRSTTTCGLDTSAKAWCWGEWGWGALGQSAEMLAPDMCDGTIQCVHQGHDVGLTGVTQVAVGRRLGIALLNDGTVWAWGLNDGGQLGHPPGTGQDGKCKGDTTQMSHCNAVPTAVPGLPPP